MSLRVVLVAGDAQLRQSLRTLVDRERDVVVVGEGGADDAARMAALKPDVALVDGDERGRDAFGVVGLFAARRGRARVLVLTGRPSVDTLHAALAAGASGIAAKWQPARELVGAIRVVGQGGSYVCPDLAAAAAGGVQPVVRSSASSVSAPGPRAASRRIRK